VVGGEAGRDVDAGFVLFAGFFAGCLTSGLITTRWAACFFLARFGFAFV
jgi:hypothetical protein